VARSSCRNFCRDIRYRVIEASSGVNALRAWDEHNVQIDLLLTEHMVHAPEGMTVRYLATQLSKQPASLTKVEIFTSGLYDANPQGDFEHSRAALSYPSRPFPPSNWPNSCAMPRDGPFPNTPS